MPSVFCRPGDLFAAEKSAGETLHLRLKHPDVPVHILHVIKERPTSLKVAELTGIRHESPQVLVVKKGTVATALSPPSHRAWCRLLPTGPD